MKSFLRKPIPLHNLLWLFPLLLFAPTIFSGQALIWGTPSLQFIPWRILAWDQLQQGIWPFWNPYNGMGAPLLANYQLALYYPPSWPLYALQALGGSAWMAWGHTLILVAHLAWAGYGTAQLVKKLGLGALAQVVSGLAFSMSAFLIARAGFFSMVWSASWLPWALATVEQIAGETNLHHRWRSIAWLGLISGMQLLSGHAQITWYSLVFTGCWALVAGFSRGGWKNLLRTAGFSAVGLVIGVCFAAIQLAPTFELLQQSQRASAVSFDFAMTYSFWPWRILTFIAPNFFGNPAYGDYWGYASFWEDAVYLGLLPFLAALSTIGFLRVRKDPGKPLRGRIILLWLMSSIGLLLALGKNTPVFPFFYQHIPTFNMFQAPARYMLWPVFSLSILAAVGIDAWSRPAGQKMRRLKRASFVIVAGMAGVGGAYFLIPGIKASFIYSLLVASLFSLLTCHLAMRKPLENDLAAGNRWNWTVAIFVGVDLFIAGWGQNPATPANFYAGEQTGRQEQSILNERIYIDEQSEYRLKFGRFLRFEDYRPVEAWANMRMLNIPNLNLLNETASANNFDPLRPARYDEWMNYLSDLPESQRLPWLNRMSVTLVEKAISEDGRDIRMEAIKGSTRFAFYSCAVPAVDGIDAWVETVNIVQNNVPKIVVEGETGLSADCNLHNTDKISILFEQADRIVLAVDAVTDGWLYMADTWYPGWQADVDGTKTDIVRANYAFRAVPVQAGRHTVMIEYQPAWKVPSILVSLLGIFFIGILVWLGSPSRNR